MMIYWHYGIETIHSYHARRKFFEQQKTMDRQSTASNGSCGTPTFAPFFIVQVIILLLVGLSAPNYLSLKASSGTVQLVCMK
jgi:hypothetical protein